MKLLDSIPSLVRVDRQGLGEAYVYRTENQLGECLAASAEQRGLSPRLQVPCPLGGYADLVVEGDGRALLLCELKLQLNKRSQLRKAAEQVLSYQRHVNAEVAAIVAPHVNEELRPEFEASYPSVRLYHLGHFIWHVDQIRRSATIAERAADAIDIAVRLVGELPLSDKSVETMVSLRAAQSVLTHRLGAQEVAA